MPRVIVFDVNETLLDLAALDPLFTEMAGDAAVRREWFGQLLQSALVATVTDTYADFSTIGRSALTMIGQRRGFTLGEREREAVQTGMRTLPPHPDVRQNLERLRQAGFRLATLTNNPGQVVEAQLAHADLRGFFEQTLTADAVRRLKPAPEPYRMAAEQLGVEIGQVRLVAAHAWDIAGALRAGCVAAFVARPGMVLDPLAPVPDIVGNDLSEIVDQIIARDT